MTSFVLKGKRWVIIKFYRRLDDNNFFQIMYESVTLPAPGVYNVTCEANTRVLKVWKCVDGCGELVSCGEPVRGTTSGSRRIRCQVQVDKQTMYFCTKANFNEADQPFKYFNISIAPCKLSL